jgi:IS30 family transposase
MEVYINMSRNYSNTNLSNLDISNIEFYLNENRRPSEIAVLLKRDPSGIRKEIKKYSSYFGTARKCSNCLNKDNCHEKYLCEKLIDKVKCSKCKYCNLAVKVCSNYKINVDCELLKKNHHVCNGCEIFSKCKKVKIKYHAETAIKMHNTVQRVSRIDTKVDKFPKEFKEYLSRLIKNGISPNIIMNTLPEKYQMYKSSTSAFYEWIDKGLLDCCNLDLRNKVSRVRYGTNTVKRNTVKGHQLNGRSIENLSEDERTNRTLGIAEFDTVEGIKGGELLFTIMIPCFSLMLAFKIEHKTQEEIGKVLDHLEDVLDSYFYVLFRKVIPDNGGEFTNFEVLEKSIHENLNKRMEVYYTHTYASYEKPHIENNHILLRWLIEKGYDITQLSSDDILDIINRLNNYPRPKKGYKTPLQLLEEELGDYMLDLLNLHHIPIVELNMKDMIIKNQERTK